MPTALVAVSVPPCASTMVREMASAGPGEPVRDLLPASRGDPVAAGTGAGAAAVARPGESVLVVEDDDPVRRITVRTLEQAGFDVVSAATLEEALARIRGRTTPPHVLLTDVRMPGRSGPEVSAALSREIPGLTTVFMSGWSDDELSADGVPSGSLFLQKPFSAQDLVARIREALGEERGVPLPSRGAGTGSAPVTPRVRR